ncbi:unnamed protein product, partial [Iphiclides podalirius]
MKLSGVFSYCTRAMKSLKQSETAVTIKAPWGNLAALTWGDPSRPPVLLCPGRLQPCTVFKPLIFMLPDSFFYVALDLPGNGLSDPLPPGVRYTVMDMVPSILTVVDHYNWDNFAYIGHSLGAAVGKFFNIAYPERISKMVELDPVPAYFTSGVTTIADWYHTYYGNYYKEDNYRKHNSGPETAPKYTLEKVKELMQSAQRLTDEAVEYQLERSLAPAGDGLYRLTYDQRVKLVTLLPFPSDYLKQIYTTPKTPTLAIIALDVLNSGTYRDVPFLTDEKAWPNGNFKFKIVPGVHDVHINDPGCMAADIAAFLTGSVAKL